MEPNNSNITFWRRFLIALFPETYTATSWDNVDETSDEDDDDQGYFQRIVNSAKFYWFSR
jgi:hypothetical protein